MEAIMSARSAFLAARDKSWDEARQTAALFILCGVDLGEALAAGEAERAVIARRLRRLIERERLRGAARHWSYDLNRHIALKQALDRIRPRRDANPLS